MLPPRLSISRAMSSADRVGVPLMKSRESIEVMPELAGVSTRRPPSKTARNSTKGSRWSSFTSTRSPLESVILTIAWATTAAA